MLWIQELEDGYCYLHLIVTVKRQSFRFKQFPVMIINTYCGMCGLFLLFIVSPVHLEAKGKRQNITPLLCKLLTWSLLHENLSFRKGLLTDNR
jgi:hypothetical protein